MGSRVTLQAIPDLRITVFSGNGKEAPCSRTGLPQQPAASTGPSQDLDAFLPAQLRSESKSCQNDVIGRT